MEKTEMEEFSRSLWDSLAVANRKLIEEKAERGEKLVIVLPMEKFIILKHKNCLICWKIRAKMPQLHLLLRSKIIVPL
ncbi:MAG: hypothetical protein J6B30_08620 [Muribaculaceae bacterium]|nr:hypothetical protein [Muribaculaceae bacterium]